MIVSPLLESLIKSIKAGKGQLTQGEELESVGVSVQDHRFESGVEGEAELKLYDLAGQVEYYGLHQLFLTEKALYVLVWDASKFLGQIEVRYKALTTVDECEYNFVLTSGQWIVLCHIYIDPSKGICLWHLLSEAQ